MAVAFLSSGFVPSGSHQLLMGRKSDSRLHISDGTNSLSLFVAPIVAVSDDAETRMAVQETGVRCSACHLHALAMAIT